jgi:hypothetical protein
MEAGTASWAPALPPPVRCALSPLAKTRHPIVAAGPSSSRSGWRPAARFRTDCGRKGRMGTVSLEREVAAIREGGWARRQVCPVQRRHQPDNPTVREGRARPSAPQGAWAHAAGRARGGLPGLADWFKAVPARAMDGGKRGRGLPCSSSRPSPPGPAALARARGRRTGTARLRVSRPGPRDTLGHPAESDDDMSHP